MIEYKRINTKRGELCEKMVENHLFAHFRSFRHHSLRSDVYHRTDDAAACRTGSLGISGVCLDRHVSEKMAAGPAVCLRLYPQPVTLLSADGTDRGDVRDLDGPG